MLAPGKAGGGNLGALLAAVAGRGLSRGNRFSPERCGFGFSSRMCFDHFAICRKIWSCALFEPSCLYLTFWNGVSVFEFGISIIKWYCCCLPERAERASV